MCLTHTPSTGLISVCNMWDPHSGLHFFAAIVAQSAWITTHIPFSDRTQPDGVCFFALSEDTWLFTCIKLKRDGFEAWKHLLVVPFWFSGAAVIVDYFHVDAMENAITWPCCKTGLYSIAIIHWYIEWRPIHVLNIIKCQSADTKSIALSV